MIYVHERNLLNKINNRKNNRLSEKVADFFRNVYLPMRKSAESIRFSDDDAFIRFSRLMNEYEESVSIFEKNNHINYQSKMKSSFFEEMSCYLFKNLPRIASGEFDVFNKKVCIGLSLNFEDGLEQETKDVDFCIGKEVTIRVNEEEMRIIKPIIAVEVKTYTDATMFGEIRNTNSLLRNASPHAKTYVLMGYNSIGKKHLVGAKYIFINEMFVLRDGENCPMRAEAFQAYYDEVSSSLEHYGEYEEVTGRIKLLNH